MFLEMLLERLDEWFTAMRPKLEAITARSAETRVPAVVAAMLIERPQLLKLLALLHNTIERNVGVEEVAAFKLSLLRMMAAPAALLEAKVPALAGGGGLRLLLWTHAFVVGLSEMADPAPPAAKALEQESLALMRIDLKTELEAGLGAWLRGYKPI
jgi:hypothetical protein